MALKDKTFKFGEVQAAIICNLDAGIFLPRDWEGTVEEGFLKSIDAKAATFWNSVWMAMQFFKPLYQKEIAKRCLAATSFADHPIVMATIKALPEAYPENKRELRRELAAYFLNQRTRGSHDKKSPEYKILKAAEKALEDNTFEGCPLTVLHTLHDIGEEKAKQIVLDVLEIHP